ncbi:MAG: iron chelate uptake ABC transporter family permease subunit [bacterium]|nr:iron chelate uptake ABC transporter family permease subunit [bacterium]
MQLKQKRHAIILIILFAALVAACLITIMIGPVFIHPLLVVKIGLSKFSGSLIQPDWSSIQETIVVDIRTPRVILAVLVGMGLAIAGAAMQGLFRNPMAEPYVLGMSSGAACGAALAIVLGVGKIFGSLSIPGLAFIGATTTIFVVYNIARTEGRVPIETLLLAGIAVGFFLHAVVSFLKIIASHEALRDVVLWLMGSFALATWGDVKMVIAPILLGVGLLYLFSRELNVLQFGEETAMHLGMEVETVKRILLVASALVTAVAVSVSGIIGFVGLVIPHVVRLIIGPDHRILLPASALCGGIFLVLCDVLARTVVQPTEIPIGIITAAIGAPYFVYLLRRRKKAISWW